LHQNSKYSPNAAFSEATELGRQHPLRIFFGESCSAELKMQQRFAGHIPNLGKASNQNRNALGDFSAFIFRPKIFMME
jgi:hypothetical protein